VVIETRFDQTQLGLRLRRAREEAGLTQSAAAEALGLSPPAVNQYEAGKRGVDALTLERLGRLYGVPLRFFFGEEMPRADWEEALLSRTANLSPDVRAGIARLIEAVNDLAFLHARTGAPSAEAPYPPFPALPEAIVVPQDVALWADKTRHHFDLGVAPLPDLRGFLEAQGFKVFAVPLGRGEDALSGLFFRHPELGPIVALNADQAYTRRPFTMAHELAHALFHYDREVVLCRSNDPRPLEEFAECFATFFLVPPEALHEYLARNRWRRVTSPEQIVHLARYFGVSYNAMRRRLRDENRLDAGGDGSDVRPVALARILGYHPSRFEFGQRPLPPEERLPRTFLELAREAIQEQRLSAQRVAEMLGISEYELADRLSPDEVETPEEACA
jgi:Zn-dependent peptidase ImmA (M78 family)/transcriptional regulator with XRE-family HTH domain